MRVFLLLHARDGNTAITTNLLFVVLLIVAGVVHFSHLGDAFPLIATEMPPPIPYVTRGCRSFTGDSAPRCKTYFFPNSRTELTLVLVESNIGGTPIAAITMNDLVARVAVGDATRLPTSCPNVVTTTDALYCFEHSSPTVYVISAQTGRLVRTVYFDLPSAEYSVLVDDDSSGPAVMAFLYIPQVAIAAVSLESGDVLWRGSWSSYFGDSALLSQAAISSVNDTVVAVSSSGSVVCVRLSTGAVSWSVQLDASSALSLAPGYVYLPRPAWCGDRAFILYSTAYSSTSDSRQEQQQQLQGVPFVALISLEISTGRVVFNNSNITLHTDGHTQLNTLFYDDGGATCASSTSPNVVFAIVRGILLTFDGFNGTFLWKQTIIPSAAISSTSSGSVEQLGVVEAGVAYVSIIFDILVQVNAAVDASGRLLWRKYSNVRAPENEVYCYKPAFFAGSLYEPDGTVRSTSTGEVVFQLYTPRRARRVDVAPIDGALAVFIGAEVAVVPLSFSTAAYKLDSRVRFANIANNPTWQGAPTMVLFSAQGFVAELSFSSGAILWSLELPNATLASTDSGPIGVTVAQGVHIIVIWPLVYRIAVTRAGQAAVTNSVTIASASPTQYSFYYDQTRQSLFLSDHGSVYRLSAVDLQQLAIFSPDSTIPPTFALTVHTSSDGEELLVVGESAGVLYGLDMATLDVACRVLVEHFGLPLLQAVSYGGFVYVASHLKVFAVQMPSAQQQQQGLAAVVAWELAVDGVIANLAPFNGGLALGTATEFRLVSSTLDPALSLAERTIFNQSGQVFAVAALSDIGLVLFSQIDASSLSTSSPVIRAFNATSNAVQWSVTTSTPCFQFPGQWPTRGFFFEQTAEGGVTARNLMTGAPLFIPQPNFVKVDDVALFRNYVLISGKNRALSDGEAQTLSLAALPVPDVVPLPRNVTPAQPPAGPLPPNYPNSTAPPALPPATPVFRAGSVSFVDVADTPNLLSGDATFSKLSTSHDGSLVFGELKNATVVAYDTATLSQRWRVELAVPPSLQSTDVSVQCVWEPVLGVCWVMSTYASDEPGMISVIDLRSGRRVFATSDGLPSTTASFSFVVVDGALWLLSKDTLNVYGMPRGTLLANISLQCLGTSSGARCYTMLEYVAQLNVVVVIQQNGYTVVNATSLAVLLRADRPKILGLIGDGSRIVQRSENSSSHAGSPVWTELDTLTGQVVYSVALGPLDCVATLCLKDSEASAYVIGITNLTQPNGQFVAVSTGMSPVWSVPVGQRPVVSAGPMPQRTDVATSVYLAVTSGDGTGGACSVLQYSAAGAVLLEVPGVDDAFPCNAGFPLRGSNSSGTVFFPAADHADGVFAYQYDTVEKRIVARGLTERSLFNGVAFASPSSGLLTYMDAARGSTTSFAPVPQSVEKAFAPPVGQQFSGILQNGSASAALTSVALVTSNAISIANLSTTATVVGSAWLPAEVSLSSFGALLSPFVVVVASIDVSTRWLPFSPSSSSFSENNDRIVIFDAESSEMFPLIDISRRCGGSFANVQTPLAADGDSNAAFFTAGVNCAFRVRQSKDGRFAVDVAALQGVAISTPVVASTRVVVVDDTSLIYGIDKEAFQVRWTATAASGSVTSQLIAGTIRGREVVVALSWALLYCIDVESGHEGVMQLPPTANLNPGSDMRFIDDDGTILVVSQMSGLAALKITNVGVTLQWQTYVQAFNTQFAVQVPGAPVVYDGVALYIGDSKIGGVDVTNGAQAWTADATQCSSAVVIDDVVRADQPPRKTAYFSCLPEAVSGNERILVGYDVLTGERRQEFLQMASFLPPLTFVGVPATNAMLLMWPTSVQIVAPPPPGPATPQPTTPGDDNGPSSSDVVKIIAATIGGAAVLFVVVVATLMLYDRRRRRLQGDVPNADGAEGTSVIRDVNTAAVYESI